MEPLAVEVTSFVDVVIELTRTERDAWRVSIASPAGTGEDRMYGPMLGADQLGALNRTRIVRGMEADSHDALQEMGLRLMSALVGTSGPLVKLIVGSADIAQRSGQGVRLVVSTDAPEAAAQPWELLYDPFVKRDFVALSGWSIARTTRGDPVPVAAASAPLKVAAVISLARFGPSVKRDRDLLRSLESAFPITAQELGVQQADELAPALAGSGATVLHYASVGVAGPSGNQLLGVGDRTSELIDAHAVAEAVSLADSIRLVVLNAGETDELAAEVAHLVARDVAVVGVRGRITGDACLAFADGLYRSLAGGRPLDAAVSAARRSVYLANPRARDWSMPVLFDPSDVALVDLTTPPIPPSPSLRSATSSGDVERDRLAARRAIVETNLAALADQVNTGPSMLGYDRQLAELQAELAEIDGATGEGT